MADATWYGKTKGNAFGYKFLVFFYRTFGLQLLYVFIFPVVGVYFLYFSAKERKFLVAFYRKRLKFSFFKAVVTAFKNFYNKGIAMIDKYIYYAYADSKLRFTWKNQQNMLDLSKSNTGIIAVNAHIGNWELAGKALKNYDRKVNLLVVDHDEKDYKTVLDKKEFYKTVNKIAINKTGTLELLLKLKNKLKNKEVICFLGDRYLKGQRTIKMPFFGEEADLPIGIYHIAFTNKTPVIFLFCVKSGFNAYRFIALPPVVPENFDNAEAFVRHAIEIYVKQIESITKKYPSQWYNYFNLWQN